MRVLHVITRLILGGAQENTLYNAEDLVERHGDQVILATGPAEGPEGDLFARARKRLDVEVIPSLKRAIDPLNDTVSYRALKRLIARFRPDVVHTHSSKAGIVGRAAAHRQRVPAVIHTIHGLPFHPYERWWKNQLYISLERWAARRCDRIITVADAMIDQAVAAGIAPRQQFVTIYSGMEVEPFLKPSRSREEVRKELGIPADAIVIGKIARLFELKGHDDVIDAAPGVMEYGANVHFLFVGGGTWRDRLEQRVRNAHLADRFHFAGLVPSTRIPEMIHAMDIVVHASYREGLARVLPQALISGRPVVSYDVDGAREVVLPGETGYLATAGRRDELASGLRRLVTDPSTRRQFGERGQAMFTDRFRHENMTEAIRRVYQDVLDNQAVREIGLSGRH